MKNISNSQIAKIIEILHSRQQTLALAESCTGGMIAEWITNVPGASQVFVGGIVAYADEIKTTCLGVSKRMLAKHGAVSEAVAFEMAKNAKKILGSTWSISVTGIAGPTGGTKEKPIGTTCFGLSGPIGTQTQLLKFKNDNRAKNREQAAAFALSWLLDALSNH